LKLNLQSSKDAGFKDVPSREKGTVNALVGKEILNGKSKERFGAMTI
jgi:hypothetical protein